VVDRILQLLQYLGMSPSRFADEIGVQRSAMSHLVSGRNNPSLEFVTKVLKRFPEINTEWLISGNGSMTRPGETGEPGPRETQAPEVPYLQELPFAEEIPAKEEPPATYDKQESPKPSRTKKALGEKSAERIIIVYNDRTFRELLPEKD